MKYTINKINKLFNNEGYILLTKEYKNNKQKLEYICPKSHRSNISLNMWLRKNRCKYCSISKPLIFSDVKESFNIEGYTLLSTALKNGNKTKLKFKCPKGHEGKIIYNSWQQGGRCIYCSRDIHSFYDVKKKFENEGYILLDNYSDDKIISRKQKLNYKCPNNHISFVKYSSWLEGYRCKYCQFERAKLSFNEVKKAFESEDYVLLSENYINSKKKLKYKCPKGHINKIAWSNWNAGVRCAECSFRNWTDEELKEYENYKNATFKEMNKNYEKYKSVINPNNLKRGRGQHHVDHIFSVLDGFKNKIPITVISHPFNLRMLTEYDNISKGSRSDISIKIKMKGV